MGQAIGREIVYHDLPEEAMLQGARDNGMPEGAVQYLGVLYSVVRAGYMAAVTDEVKNVTGRDPVAFARFVKKNAECWEREK